MTPEQFCYWLHGYTEICGRLPSPEEWKVIMDHLDLVFHKVTPSKSSAPEKVSQDDIRRILQERTYCSDGKIC